MASSPTFTSAATVSSAPDRVPALLGHGRWLVAVAIGVVAALTWAWLMAGAGMGEMAPMDGKTRMPFPTLALMWAVMMAAMMLPASAPLVLLYAKVREGHQELPQSAVLLSGYLLVWTLFGLIAAAVQHQWLAGAGALGDRSAQAALLATAGLYQFTPLKRACLGRCRSPAAFLSRHFRPGPVGALRLGIIHGIVCVGCCWLLMLLLFVGGVMNLGWVALLTFLVSAEKLLPGGERTARLAGVALIVWAIVRVQS